MFEIYLDGLTNGGNFTGVTIYGGKWYGGNLNDVLISGGSFYQNYIINNSTIQYTTIHNGDIKDSEIKLKPLFLIVKVAKFFTKILFFS